MSESENRANTKMVGVDNLYIIDIPEDWSPYKSDKFRTVNKDGNVSFSASNYGKALDKNDPFNIELLKSQTLKLFDKFIYEGGYEPINDCIAGNNFIYQAFKVDEETQYYYFTYREARGELLRIVFIIREIGDYNPKTKDILLDIGDSLKLRVI